GLSLFWLLNEQHLPKNGILDGKNTQRPLHADPEMAKVIQKACMYEPRDRFAGAEEMFAALQALQPETIESCAEETVCAEAQDSAHEVSETDPRHPVQKSPEVRSQPAAKAGWFSRVRAIWRPDPASAFRTVGSIVTFGACQQGAKAQNSREIEWVVLDVRDGKALLISRCALDWQPYHEVLNHVTWETCSLRRWLNSVFITRAFTDRQREAIVLTRAENGAEQGISRMDGGRTTQDRLFLLSWRETQQYLNPETLQCNATEFVHLRQGENAREAGCGWWSRSPGQDSSSAVVIFSNHQQRGLIVNAKAGVRPALWVDLGSLPD
ncbi:MAG: hypothetical protein IJI38_07245, partial [Clostridia bacterium]|nr:hypothetical protein [Clostridia bacterium]